MEDAHKDSAANRKVIFPLGYVHPLTDKKSVSNSKIMPLTDKKSVSEKFSKYIIQKTLFRRDKCKQCIAEILLELSGRCS